MDVAADELGCGVRVELSGDTGEPLDPGKDSFQKITVQLELCAFVCAFLDDASFRGAVLSDESLPVSADPPINWTLKAGEFGRRKDTRLSDFVSKAMQGVYSSWFQKLCVRHGEKPAYTVQKFMAEFANKPFHVLEQMKQDLKGVSFDGHEFVSRDVWELLQSAASVLDFLGRLAVLYQNKNDVDAIADDVHQIAYEGWRGRQNADFNDQSSASPPG